MTFLAPIIVRLDYVLAFKMYLKSAFFIFVHKKGALIAPFLMQFIVPCFISSQLL